jgi:hypothetical protein
MAGLPTDQRPVRGPNRSPGVRLKEHLLNEEAIARGERTWRLSYANSNARKRRMPAIVNTNRELIEGAIKAVTDPRAVFAALEANRRLLVENKILLAAVGNESSDHSSWGLML